jgi:hypothetical protein
MFPNAFSSQQRCIVPTNIFAASSGYGCFTYVPLLWFEDARTVDTETFFRFYDHYYSRPGAFHYASRVFTRFQTECLTSRASFTCHLFQQTGRRS